MVIPLLFCGWLLSAIAFEYAFDLASRRHPVPWAKGELTKMYWLVLGVVGMAAGGVYWWCQVIALLPVAVSHVDLARRGVARVRLMPIVENIPAAFRRCGSHLHDVFR